MRKKIRYTFFIFCVIFFRGNFLCAQADSMHTHPGDEPEWGIHPYVQLSHLFFNPSQGILDVSFPYRISGIAGTQTFKDTIAGFGRGGTFVTFGLAVNHHNFSFDANMSPFTSIGTGTRLDFFLGVTYRLRYDQWIPSMADLQTQFLSFPVSFTVGLQNYNAISNLGQVELDSTHRFQAFGGSLGLSENENETGTVKIFFQETVFAFSPSINIGFRPRYSMLEFSLRFGPFIPFYNKGGLNFFYRDSDSDDTHSFPNAFGTVPMHGFGVQSHFNGKSVPDAPYPISGWMLSFRVGFNSGNIAGHHHYHN
ncbi:MAG: hypothetical protein HY064_16080 [Bacteroidetes bacterium]|nr:hypothetical protein [Bacteroidota bacterium]